MLRHPLLVGLFGLMTAQVLPAQPVALGDSLRSDGRRSPNRSAGRNERPDKPKFIVEADQRFFYFKDAHQPLLRHPTNVWGARAGFLLPSNVKLGVGYYFSGQSVDESWANYQLVHRRLHYGTVYVEPYFFRRPYWELSALVEAGVGAARYTLLNTDNQQPAERRTIAVPLTVGVSASVKFPTLFGFRPLRWFGINLLSGYRYTLQQGVPTGPSTLNGVYYSVSPAIFLDRIYQDVSGWRKGRRSRKP